MTYLYFTISLISFNHFFQSVSWSYIKNNLERKIYLKYLIAIFLLVFGDHSTLFLFQNMLFALDMEFEGQPHSGLDDAKNIARVLVIFKTASLMNRTRMFNCFYEPINRILRCAWTGFLLNRSNQLLKCFFLLDSSDHRWRPDPREREDRLRQLRRLKSRQVQACQRDSGQQVCSGFRQYPNFDVTTMFVVL